MINMTIQIPNPGTGNGATGDNEFEMWTKVKDNFTNQSHAASRLIGTAAGQIPLAEDAFKAANSRLTSYITDSTADANDFERGSKYIVTSAAKNTSPFDNQQFGVQIIKTYGHHSSQNTTMQEAIGHSTGQRSVRISTGAWQPITTHTANYTRTTASGANVVVDSTGALMRSTSSERYKDILADLVLDDVAYKNAMKLAPIVYRSTADADNPDYHYYSFSAEALGAFDPAFTLWRDTEMITDDQGYTTEQPLTERVAEGININALLAFSHAIAIKQDKMLTAQATAIAALTKRIDELTAE